ncbi:hypothetical protein BDZ89DRAFT_1053498 [Hymenopellis radicata]|nr:hypothetical protein BDZ89DRAFT_1053498 [Hymenopellis radicata]
MASSSGIRYASERAHNGTERSRISGGREWAAWASSCAPHSVGGAVAFRKQLGRLAKAVTPVSVVNSIQNEPGYKANNAEYNTEEICLLRHPGTPLVPILALPIAVCWLSWGFRHPGVRIRCPIGGANPRSRVTTSWSLSPDPGPLPPHQYSQIFKSASAQSALAGPSSGRA